MTWRGSTTVKDRILGSLPYLLPILDALPYSNVLLSQFPALAILFVPLQPLISIYFGFPFAGLIVFFVLFLAVVRNPKISHFIRFNTMQAILLDIILVLCGMFLRIVVPALGQNLLTQTLFNLVFLGTLIACIYTIVQSLIGRYAEIPAISDAVYSQVQ